MLDGSILKNLVYGRADRGQTPINFGVYYKNTLIELCHALEDFVIASDSAPLMVTAFQRGKWYLQEADRYGELAQISRQIVILAADDSGFRAHPTGQHPAVSLVELAEDDPVAQEWHLMIFAPDYTAMVLCQELSVEDYGPQGVPDNDLERKFYGFWTFEPALVAETMALAVEHLGPYDGELQARVDSLLQDLRRQQTESAGAADAGAVATRVVQYLQSRRADLGPSSPLPQADDLQRNLMSNELQAFLRMAQLVDLSDPVNTTASVEVVALLDMLGQLLDLPAWQMQRLRLAGMLHRVVPTATVSPAEVSDAPSCPLEAGVQALRVMPRLRAVATIIAHQQEWWDGSGQPARLMGDSIPLESRMLGLVSQFQHHLAHIRYQQAGVTPQMWEDALQRCRDHQGQRWDPKLVEMLALMVKGLQQGLALPSLPHRMTLGAGLLNPDLGSSLDEVSPLVQQAMTNP